MKIHIIVGDAFYPKDINTQIEDFMENKELINVATTAFSSKDHNKTDYIVVTITYKEKTDE